MASTKRMSILMADDSSKHAHAAVELLLNVSLPPRSRVHVLRVFTPSQIDGLPEFEKRLERRREQFSNAGIKAETGLVLGSPAEKIILTAQEKKSDMIVLGARGLRSTLGILLGGVAQQVVEYAHCPVLVVRAPYQGLRRVLLVTDGSRHSQLATRYLGKFPLPPKAEIHVMHVMAPLEYLVNIEPFMGGTWYPQYVPIREAHENAVIARQQKQKGQALLKRTCDLLKNYGSTAIPVLMRGDATTEIMEYVKSAEINLIVAGSRGLGQFEGAWMGSVSRKLVHYSNCSVLVVKGPKKE